MHDRPVSMRYALAIFNSASGAGVVDSVEQDLAAIAGLLDRDEQFRTFLTDPTRMREDKLKIVDKLFSDRITALSMQLLRLLLQKGREEHFPDIYADFIALRRAQQGIMQATVSSAEALPDDQRKSVVEKLEKLIGKKVEPTFEIDPALIGGVKVTYDNYALDGSVQGALRTLREKLNQDLVKQA